MWLDLAIVVGSGGAGIVCGWFLHAIGGITHQDRESADIGTPGLGTLGRGSSSVERPGRIEPASEQIHAVAQQLRAAAVRMAADVDAHQSRVQSVNHSLAERHDPSAEAVAQAVSELIEANQKMQVQLQQAQQRIHHQTIQIETAERRAQTDALTRVPNRRAFDDYLRTRTERGVDGPGTLALIDIDHFKRLNDLHGHRAGDEVLRQVAQLLFTRLHAYGLVARIGGEEFAVLLEGISLSDSVSLLEHVRRDIGETAFSFENHGLRVTASLGVASFNPGDTVANWIQRADEGLYQSKDAGRDCGHWMDGETPVRIGTGGSTHHLAARDPAMPDARSTHDVDAMSSTGKTNDRQYVMPTWIATEITALRALENQFEELRERGTLGGPIVMMAVRLSPLATEAESLSTMQVVRATTRGVDRMGSIDAWTMLICLPGLSQKMAAIKARQILHGVESCGLRWMGTGTRPVGIGIVEVESMESFDSAVSRALRLAEEARCSLLEAIVVEQQEYLQA